MVAVPVAAPVTIPKIGSIVATAVLLLVHSPPAIVSLSAVVAPMHVLSIPAMAEGDDKTVITADVLQPVGNV
jgi:hypothetical protein